MQNLSHQHWTAESDDAFVSSIATGFFGQIESKLEEGPVTQQEFATRLGRTPGRVSQILNNPGNSTIKKMVRCARALGLKVAIIAYDDNDPGNANGPITPDVFNICWERSAKPRDLFSLAESAYRYSFMVGAIQPTQPAHFPTREPRRQKKYSVKEQSQSIPLIPQTIGQPYERYI